MNERSTSPLVSIIIPCFNSEKYIAETINSALNQTYKNCEIIVVNDGSTDKSGDIIRSYGSKIISFHGENKGASAARNKGTEIAKGKFIQYLDSDDLLTPDSLEIKVKALIDSEYDVAYTDWQKLVLQEDGTFKLKEKIIKQLDHFNLDPQIAIFNGFWAPPASLLYRRAIVEKIGQWNESLPVIQDARFLLDAALLGANFIHISGVRAYYRVHDSISLSRRDDHKFMADIYRNSSQIESLWRAHDSINEERISALAANYDYSARNLFHMDYGLFKKNLESLYNVQPGFRFTWPKVACLLSNILGYKISSIIMKSLFPLNQKDSNKN